MGGHARNYWNSSGFQQVEGRNTNSPKGMPPGCLVCCRGGSVGLFPLFLIFNVWDLAEAGHLVLLDDRDGLLVPGRGFDVAGGVPGQQLDPSLVFAPPRSSGSSVTIIASATTINRLFNPSRIVPERAPAVRLRWSGRRGAPAGGRRFP